MQSETAKAIGAAMGGETGAAINLAGALD